MSDGVGLCEAVCIKSGKQLNMCKTPLHEVTTEGRNEPDNRAVVEAQPGYTDDIAAVCTGMHGIQSQLMKSTNSCVAIVITIPNAI